VGKKIREKVGAKKGERRAVPQAKAVFTAVPVAVVGKVVLPEFPRDGSLGPNGGFMWVGREDRKTCTCAQCVPWRKKVGMSLVKR